MYVLEEVRVSVGLRVWREASKKLNACREKWKVAVVTFCCRAGGHTPHPSTTPYSEPSINLDLQYHLTAFLVNNKPSYLNSLDPFNRYRCIIIIIIIIPTYKI